MRAGAFPIRCRLASLTVCSTIGLDAGYSTLAPTSASLVKNRQKSKYNSKEASIMIKIAEALGTRPGPLWRLVKQCGVNYVVGGMDFSTLNTAKSKDDLPWGYMSLLRV